MHGRPLPILLDFCTHIFNYTMLPPENIDNLCNHCPFSSCFSEIVPCFGRFFHTSSLCPAGTSRRFSHAVHARPTAKTPPFSRSFFFRLYIFVVLWKKHDKMRAQQML